ncbi:MAG: AzlD domain-containing protein [Clostridiales bacterium]|nr:AzlD domain-containing protein [Candidatus Coliplasma caballi]
MSGRFFLYLAVMAGVTYLIRMLPMLLIKRQIKNVFLLSFLSYIPYTVLAVMTVPAVFYATQSPLSAAIGVGVAIVLALFDRSLLTVAFSACGAVFLTEWIMTLIP